MTARNAARVSAVARHGALALGAAGLLAPVVLMVAASLTPSGALGAGRVLDTVTTENYALVWREQPIAMFYAHSALVAACTVLFQLAICIPAAFAMSRLRFVGRQAWSVATTALLVVPFQVVAVPVYLLLREVGLVDTLAALILPFVGSALALVLLRQAFMTLPTEMLDAARLDGAGTAALLWRVVVPSSRPAIAALAVLTLTAAWNAYFWPSFVLTDASRATVPFGLVAYLNTESGSRYGPQMAMATLSVLPLLAVFLLLQRHLVRGLTTAGQPG